MGELKVFFELENYDDLFTKENNVKSRHQNSLI